MCAFVSVYECVCETVFVCVSIHLCVCLESFLIFEEVPGWDDLLAEMTPLLWFRDRRQESGCLSIYRGAGTPVQLQDGWREGRALLQGSQC
jgi:hypothetical protein